MNTNWQSFEEEFRQGKPGDSFPTPGQPQPAGQGAPAPQQDAYSPPPERSGGSIVLLAVVAIVGAAVIGGGAAFMLARNQPPPEENPFAPNADDVEQQQNAANETDTKIVQVLIGDMNDSRDDKVHEEAQVELIKLGKVAVPELIKELEHKQTGHIYYAAVVLSEMEPEDTKDAAKALTSVLDHHDDTVRAVVVKSLVKIGAPAVPHLCDTIRNADRTRTRLYAMETLATIGPVTEQVVPTMVGVLTDPDAGVRDVATSAVGKLGKAAVPALMERLGDSDPNMQFRAAMALSEVGPDAAPAVEKLHPLLQSNERNVRAMAAKALGKIGPPHADVAAKDLISMLQDDYKHARTNAEEALASLGATVVGDLIKALEDANDELQQRLGRILGKLGKPAVKPLTVALDHEKTQVRLWAAAALGTIGRDAVEALPKLEKMLKDPDDGIRYYAEKAVKSIKK